MAATHSQENLYVRQTPDGGLEPTERWVHQAGRIRELGGMPALAGFIIAALNNHDVDPRTWRERGGAPLFANAVQPPLNVDEGAHLTGLIGFWADLTTEQEAQGANV